MSLSDQISFIGLPWDFKTDIIVVRVRQLGERRLKYWTRNELRRQVSKGGNECGKRVENDKKVKLKQKERFGMLKVFRKTL